VNRNRHWFSGTMTVLVLAFMFLPILMVFINAFNADEDLASWGGFTTRWFREVASDTRIREDFVASLTIALATTALSLVIAVTAALWIRGASSRSRAAFDITNVMRLVLPEIVIAVGLFVLFRRLDVPLGWSTIVVGHVVFLSAYATVVLQARVASMGGVLEEAAGDLGATPWRAFRRVTLPQLMPAVAVAGLLVFTFSLDDVITSQFLGGSAVETLPVLLLGLIRHQVTPEVNAVGSILIIITLTTFSVAVATAGLSSVGGLKKSARKDS
jgi:ABC-type spermidine/putrescine transport system permease subunit II